MFAKEAVIIAYKKLDDKLRKLEQKIEDLEEQLNFIEEDKKVAKIDLKLCRGDIEKIRLPIKRIEEVIHEEDNRYMLLWNIITKPVSSYLKEKIESSSITPQGEEKYLIEHPYFDKEKQKFVRGPIPDEFYETDLYLPDGRMRRVKHVDYIKFTLNASFKGEKYWDIDMKVKEIIKK